MRQQQCKDAAAYTADQAPTCGCVACWDRWQAKQRARARAVNARARRMEANRWAMELQRPHRDDV
jgi:hypothetical protein